MRRIQPPKQPTKAEALERLHELHAHREQLHPAEYQELEYDAIHLALEVGATNAEVSQAIKEEAA